MTATALALKKKPNRAMPDEIVEIVRGLAEREHAKGHLLTREVIYEEAKTNKSSPLRRYFTWDNTKAAEERRLEQASIILQCCYIEAYLPDVPNPVPMRVVVSLPSDRVSGGGMRLLTRVLKNQGLRKQYIENALSELKRIKTQYEFLTELVKVWREIDNVDQVFNKPRNKK